MKKRLMAMLVSMAVVASGIIPVFAAVPTKEEVANSIKIKLEVPPEYKEFNIDYNVDSEGKTSYWIKWRNDEGENRGNINVSCDEDGHISNMSRNYYDDRESVLIKDSRDAVLKIIEEELIKLVPECFNDNDTYKIDSSLLDMNGNGSASYMRYKDGIRVWDNTINANFQYINDNYKITYLTVNHDYDAVFDELTDGESIKESYMKLSQNELQYNLVYEYDKEAQKGKRVPVLRYVLEDAPFMNPINGEKIEPDKKNYISYKYASADMVANEATMVTGAGGLILTEEEIAELDKVNNLKSTQECEKLLKSIPELYVDEAMKVTSSRVYKSDEKYYIELNLSNEENDSAWSWCSAKLNAQTGKIVNFYNVDDTVKNDDEVEMTEEELKGVEGGEEFLKKYGDGFDDYVLKEKTGRKTSVDYFCNEKYVKHVNGIPFTDATADIMYNTETNRVYSLNINERKAEADFPAPEKAITKEQAFETIFNVYPLERVFVKSGGSFKTAYVMPAVNTIVDAISNTIVSYDNSPIEPMEKVYTYNDISGHWAEDVINSFAQFGIGFEGGSFKPDEKISWEDFTDLMNEVGIYHSVDGFDMSGDITREKAVGLLVKGMGFERVAKLQGIFATQFTDEAEIAPEFLGSCAISVGMGIISGMDGKFCPKNTVTRAQAFMMLYNYKINN